MSTAVESNPNRQITCEPEPAFRAGVVIVSYNARSKLMVCLESLLNSLPADCDLIVVDNASVEGNADAIAERFPGVKLIRSPVNLGFAGGCNLGARHTESEFLVFLNPDTLVERGWMDALLAPFADDRRIGLTTARILLLKDPTRLNTCGNNIHLTGLTLCRGMGQGRDAYPRREPVAAISGAACAIPTELFRQLGGFDESFFLYLEDTDLSWRARLAGRETVYVPDCVVLHDYELRITPKKVFWQERNRLLMLLKSLRWPTLILMLPALLLAEVIAWSFVLMRDRRNAANKLRAYGWIMTNWRRVLAKRRETQAGRAVSDRVLIKSTGFRIEFEQAATGGVVAVARFVFDPLFFILRGFTLALLWW